MARASIDRLIINNPYAEPELHWRYERETRSFDLVEGRSQASYVVASGLRVKNWLAVLELSAAGNYYEAFNILPSTLLDKLRQGKVLERNWHVLPWDIKAQFKRQRSVDDRGIESPKVLEVE
ncbi:MAG: hypothetical protein NTV14_10555 [Coprothermobacterota bacterium]|nr:hypothetical protein [Coprothermobacterota bacterium]